MRELAIIGLAAAALGAHAQILVGQGPLDYSQNFDSLPSESTPGGQAVTNGFRHVWTDDTTLAGWYRTTQTTSATARPEEGLIASNGTANSGALYSFGPRGAGDLDRALGSLGSGTTSSINYGVVLRNDGTVTLAGFQVDFVYEHWRRGTNANVIDFSWKKNASSLLDADGWNGYAMGAQPLGAAVADPVAGADLQSDYVSVVGTNIALDGNDPSNRSARTFGLAGLSLAPGESLTLRWTDKDTSGSDAGVGLDDFRVQAVPEPASMIAVALGLSGLAARRRRR